jgi:hypothetical protein
MMKGNAKMRVIAAILAVTLFCAPLSVLAEDQLTRDMQQGIDISSLRCGDNIIAIGDSPQVVMSKCGEPLRKASTIQNPFNIWVYRFDSSDSIYYLSFSGESLERIIEAECWADNPDCK